MASTYLKHHQLGITARKLAKRGRFFLALGIEEKYRLQKPSKQHYIITIYDKFADSDYENVVSVTETF